MTPLNWYVLFFFRQKVCFTYHLCLSGAPWPCPPKAFSQLCLFNEQSSTWSNLQGSCPHLPGEARGTCATRQPQFLLPLRFLTLKLLISPLSQTFSFKETIQLHNEYMPLDSIYFAYWDFQSPPWKIKCKFALKTDQVQIFHLVKNWEVKLFGRGIDWASTFISVWGKLRNRYILKRS